MNLPEDYLVMSYRKAILTYVQEHLRSLEPGSLKPVDAIQAENLPATIAGLPVSHLRSYVAELEQEIISLETGLEEYKVTR